MTTTETIADQAELYAALAAFQAELPTMGKDNTATVTSDKAKYTYKYADLSDLSPLVLPLLGKHGLSWLCRPTMRDNRFVLVYTLAHSSGQVETGEWPLVDPTRCTPQQMGSAVTYGRRYCLCAVTGIAPGSDDDDAAAASNRPPRPKDSEPEQTPADTARAEIIAVMEAQQLNANHVIQGYYRRHKLDLRDDQDVARLRAFATALRKDPDTALAVDPGTGQPTGPRAVKDAS